MYDKLFKVHLFNTCFIIKQRAANWKWDPNLWKPLHLLFSGVQTKTPEVECSATVVRAYLLHYFCLISGTYM